MNHSTPGLPVHHQLPEFKPRLMSVMPSSHLILCFPLLLLPPIPPSIRVFSNESTLHMRWPKYWSFSFSIISSKEIPGLISITLLIITVNDTVNYQLTHCQLFCIKHHSPYACIGLSYSLQCQSCTQCSNTMNIRWWCRWHRTSY